MKPGSGTRSLLLSWIPGSQIHEILFWIRASYRSRFGSTFGMKSTTKEREDVAHRRYDDQPD
jgi:hypothetical protein